MANSRYNESGYLVAGKISCTGDEFISEFCQTDIRKDFQSAVVNILDFAKDKGASRIIVGGSFVSKKDNPNDLDCLIVFPNDLMIPSFVDCALFDKIQYDILYASEQNPKSIDTFIKLLSTNIYMMCKIRGLLKYYSMDCIRGKLIINQIKKKSL